MDQLIPEPGPPSPGLQCVGLKPRHPFGRNRHPVSPLRQPEGPGHLGEMGWRQAFDGVLSRPEPDFIQGKAASLKLGHHLRQRSRPRGRPRQSLSVPGTPRRRCRTHHS